MLLSRDCPFGRPSSVRPFHVNQCEMSLCNNLVPKAFPLEIRRGGGGLQRASLILRFHVTFN